MEAANRLQRSRLALVTLGHFLNDSYGTDIEQPLPGRNLIYLAYFLSKELKNLSS